MEPVSRACGVGGVADLTAPAMSILGAPVGMACIWMVVLYPQQTSHPAVPGGVTQEIHQPANVGSADDGGDTGQAV